LRWDQRITLPVRPIGRAVKKFGEPKLIAGSLIIFGLSMAPLPYIKGDSHLTLSTLVQSQGLPWLMLLFVAAWLAIGSGLTRPPPFGLLSDRIGHHRVMQFGPAFGAVAVT
jgi:MFS family permease